MVQVVDALVVTLGLDASAYKRVADQVTATSTKKKQALTKDERDLETLEKRRNDSLGKYQRDLDARNEKNIQSVGKLATEFLGLFGIVEGAKGIKDFFNGVIDNNLAVGQLAHNLEISTEDLSVWQNAVKLTGGDAKDLDGTLQALSGTFQAGLHGQVTPAVGALRTLGIQFGDLQNPLQGLYEIGAKLRGLPPQQANYLAQMIGIGPDTLRLLEENAAAFQKTMDTAREGNQVTAQSVDEAKAAKAATEGWTQALDKFGNALAINVLPNLTKLVGMLTNVLPEIEGFLTGGFIGLYRKVEERVKGMEQGTPAKSGSAVDWDGKSTGSAAAPSASIAGFFVKRGFTPEQAQGIAAGIQAESRSDPNAVNPTSGAYGIGQWLGDRKKKLFEMFGPNPGLASQLQFMSYELKGGDRGGAAVRGAGSAEDALRAYITQFMRPAPGAETAGDLSRGMASLRGGFGGSAGSPAPGVTTSKTDMSIGTIIIQTQATDAKGIAKGIGPALKQYGFVTQSDPGLTG